MLAVAEQSGCVITVSRALPGPRAPPAEKVFQRVAGSGHPEQAGADTCGALALKENGLWSCSGVILDQGLGIVLCHGTIFSPFLSLPIDTAWSDCRLLRAEDFSQDLQIQVQYVAESKSTRESGSKKDMGATSIQLGFNPLSNHGGVPSGIQQCQAELLLLVPCLEFHNALSMLFHQADNWHFSSLEEEQESVTLQKALAHLHWFAVLHILSPCMPGMGTLSCMPASELQKGRTLFTCGSPFGSFYPNIFINSLSKGVVSNLAGESNAVILTDARCLPGTEGGGVFAVQEDCLKLVGLIVAPLCWKAGEWVGLTLVCSVGHILESLQQVLDVSENSLCLSLPHVTQHIESVVANPWPGQCLMAAVVLVECDRSWGSGVLLNPRMVVTCRHVVAQTFNVRIHGIRRHAMAENCGTTRGRVVFMTQKTSPYDVAVLELDESFDGIPEPVLGSQFRTGEDVSILSFGIFGKRCGPSVTSGILSAVVTVDDAPVMLQTTCAVHGGSSGGALMATHTGELLGIIASNTRDSSVGATYPHLNFSVPISVLEPVLQQYHQSQDLRAFQQLNQASGAVAAAWRLQSKPTRVLPSRL
ncbi:peroxisomal leader peptide-processing protease [Rhinatrema bivittatum]|uniref:peroxisomal leader peptide-processing protease n=1 Tax=Rhinatrema bivittatum TaxID=194408 RepID=UPI00112AE507|nr:peroxisomal leader peptide-processing protease [Rhinatrema bivittatum]